MGRTAALAGLGISLSVQAAKKQRPDPDARIDAHVRVRAVAVGPRDRIPAVDIALVVAVDVAAGRRDAAVAALTEAVGALPDGISYTVLGGGASQCYPLRGRWALADPADRRDAAFSVGRIAAADERQPPAGYTTWLARARELFAERALPVRHLVLVTDGAGRADEDDASRPDSALSRELARCEGEFTADVVAPGAGWDPAPLIAVAERLHGAAGSSPDAFAPAVATALGRLRKVRSPELPIEVTVRPNVREATLIETAPHQQRLEPEPVRDDPRRLEFRTHQWKPESRDYLLTLRADAGNDPLGVPLQLAAVTVGGATEAVVVRWLPSGTAAATARISGAAGRDIHTMNVSTRMRTALNDGYAALDLGSRERAEAQLGLAVRLATEIAADWVLDEVRKVARIVDGPRGVVRIGPAVDPGAVRQGMLSITSGHPMELPPAPPDGPALHCPYCDRPAGPAAVFCIHCGRQL
ncbi:VWA domain-containing protein [Streptomyces atratus]|uniref:von Willebrand factor type A domain-containing protein n=1 Tax=Streptomyces atratus TaxID=1893 RepID=A0A1K2DTH7_STRAR|nr:hypothetical protein [Streptomyces atratus]SFY26290.1 von Willebrand factor type A domain-containing protein [Streptomyces atratus]